MAKKTAQPESISVHYDLHELPTAQHKAGLAGLLLQIESMRERIEAGALPADTQLPEVVEQGPAHATVRFTKQNTQDLFDDLYEAEWVEVEPASKWAGKQPKEVRTYDRTDPKTGRVKQEKRYVYDVVQPVGPFLRRYTDDGKEVWHKLWREMLWAIPRGRPTTRKPFETRAEGRPTKDGADAWKALLAHKKAIRKGGFKAVEVAGAVMLGAQAVNAEAMKFKDRADHALLLHFWQLSVRIFVPEEVDADGNREFAGYVLAVPEVSDLPKFCRAYSRMLNELQPMKRGYRPADAVVSLPAEGSLEFMRHLADLVERQVLDESPSRYLDGIEFFHMIKAGNNIKSAAHGRVPPRDQLLRAYQGIRAQNKNPLMRTGRLLAMLHNQPWFSELAGPLMEREWSFFVHSTHEQHRTPWSMVGFTWEVNKEFQQIQQRYETMKEADVLDADHAASDVDRLIYDLVHKYVRSRACAKADIAEDAAGWWNKTADQRRDVASKLFLALRSRQGDEFVQHFTATLGSVPQWLNEPRFLAVTDALMREYTEEVGQNRPRTRDDVKTLTLLALSAASRSLTNRRDEDQQAQETTEESTE